MIEFLAYNLVGLMFLLMVVAPLVNHAAGGPMPGACLMAAMNGASHRHDPAPGFDRRELAERAARRRVVPDPAAVAPAVPRIETAATEDPAAPASDIDIAGIEGRMQAASVRRVADIVDSRPREAAAVLRSWLNEDPS